MLAKLNEEDFKYVGYTFKGFNNITGFVFRVYNESAEYLKDKYDIQRARIRIFYIYEDYSHRIEIEGHSDPLESDAICKTILLEDENVIKPILQNTINKNKNG